MSALPPKADIGTRSWDVRFVPKADICSAAKIPLFDHLVGELLPLLLLLGVVLGVNQVALGIQLMLGGISGLIARGVFTVPGN